MKNIIKKFLFLVLLMGFITNCTTIRINDYDSKKKIEAEKKFLGNVYEQGNDPINTLQMLKDLGQNESTKPDITKFHLAFWPAMALSVFGGWQIGSSTGDGGGNAGTGLLMVGAGLLLGHFADGFVYDAVKKHNSALKENSYFRNRSKTPMLSYGFEF